MALACHESWGVIVPGGIVCVDWGPAQIRSKLNGRVNERPEVIDISSLVAQTAGQECALNYARLSGIDASLCLACFTLSRVLSFPSLILGIMLIARLNMHERTARRRSIYVGGVGLRSSSTLCALGRQSKI